MRVSVLAFVALVASPAAVDPSSEATSVLDREIAAHNARNASAAGRREMMRQRPIASTAYVMNRVAWAAKIVAWLAVGAAAPARANVITDRDEKAIPATAALASVPSPSTPYAAYRMMGMVHAAMFDAVNSIEPRHRPVSGAALRGRSNGAGRARLLVGSLACVARGRVARTSLIRLLPVAPQ